MISWLTVGAHAELESCRAYAPSHNQLPARTAQRSRRIKMWGGRNGLRVLGAQWWLRGSLTCRRRILEQAVLCLEEPRSP